MIKVSHKAIDKQNIYYIINWYQTLEEEKKIYEAYCSTSFTLLNNVCLLIAFNCDHYVGKNFEVSGVRKSCLKMSSKRKFGRQSLKENG